MSLCEAATHSPIVQRFEQEVYSKKSCAQDGYEFKVIIESSTYETMEKVSLIFALFAAALILLAAVEAYRGVFLGGLFMGSSTTALTFSILAVTFFFAFRAKHREFQNKIYAYIANNREKLVKLCMVKSPNTNNLYYNDLSGIDASHRHINALFVSDQHKEYLFFAEERSGIDQHIVDLL